MTTKEIGVFGEAAVAKYLRERGYILLAHGYRCRFGEIDLIAQKRNTLAFVEVKLRSPHSYGLPREAVDAVKREKLRKTALSYLAEKKLDIPARFDVAEVYIAVKDIPQIERIEYIENAF